MTAFVSPVQRRAYGDRLINCLVGLERFAEEPRIVLRLAEYMSGGVLARRDSETRRVLQAVFTEPMEFAPFNEGECLDGGSRT